MYGQKRNGDPEEIRITVYKNDAGKENSPQTFGKQKEQPTSLNNYQAPSNQKAIVEKPGKLLLTPQPTYVRKSGEAETQNCRKHKTHKSGVCFPGYKLDAFKSRGSHKREE